MNCWMCGLRMIEVIQKEDPPLGFWVCYACDVESCLPGGKRKTFKCGWDYKADQTAHLYWDGKGVGEDHYTSVLTIDHGREHISHPC